MLAFERSERVSITTGTAKHKNVAGGDPMRSPTTLSGSPSATTGMVAIAVVPGTSLATLVSLPGTTGYSTVILRVFFWFYFAVLLCLHDVALDEGGGGDFFMIQGRKVGIFIYFCRMNVLINLLTH